MQRTENIITSNRLGVTGGTLRSDAGDDTKVPKLSGPSNASGTNLGGERRFVLAKWPEDACGGALIVTSKVKRVRLMHPVAGRDTATRLRTP